MKAQKNRSRHMSLAKCGLTLLLIFSLFIVKAQPPTNTGDDKIYAGVDKQPEFAGGISKFYDFLKANLRYPKDMRDNNVQGNVIVTFIIEKDGSLSNIKSVRDLGHGSGEEAIRVMALSPKWIAGEQGGKAVRVQYTIPIRFTLGAANK